MLKVFEMDGSYRSNGEPTARVEVDAESLRRALTALIEDDQEQEQNRGL